MQITVKADVKKLTRNLSRIQRRQIPFATSYAMNQTIVKVWAAEKGQLPKRLKFPTKQTVNALTYTKSNKRNLVASVQFRPWASEYMKYQVYGGTRPVNSVVVPLNQYGGKLNKSGNIPSRKAKGWAKRNKQFFVESKGKTLLMRPKGKDDQIVVGVIAKNPRYKKLFPFYRIAESVVAKYFPREFSKALTKALATAR